MPYLLHKASLLLNNTGDRSRTEPTETTPDRDRALANRAEARHSHWRDRASAHEGPTEPGGGATWRQTPPGASPLPSKARPSARGSYKGPSRGVILGTRTGPARPGAPSAPSPHSHRCHVVHRTRTCRSSRGKAPSVPELGLRALDRSASRKASGTHRSPRIPTRAAHEPGPPSPARPHGRSSPASLPHSPGTKADGNPLPRPRPGPRHTAGAGRSGASALETGLERARSPFPLETAPAPPALRAARPPKGRRTARERGSSAPPSPRPRAGGPAEGPAWGRRPAD